MVPPQKPAFYNIRRNITLSAAFHPFEIPKRLAILLLEKTNENKILQDFGTIFSKQKSISFFRSFIFRHSSEKI